MWSVVLLVFDALIQTVTMSDGISSTTLRYSEFSRHRPRWIAPAAVGASWLAASTSLFPLGVALTAGSDTGDVVLEDVCAVSMKRDDAVAQAITAFLLPAAVALAGCVAIVCRNFRRFTGLDMQQTNKPGITDNDFWVSPVALTVACCVTWSPFFALYAALPFCPYDRMCIDPGAWTVLAWFGYATSVLGPVCWIVGDRYYRFQFRVAVRRLMSTCSDRRGHWKPQLSSSVKSPPVPTQNDDEEDPTQLLAGQKAPLNKTSLVPSSSGTISEQSSEILVMTV